MRHNQLHKPQIAAAGVSARGTSTSKAQQTASSGSDGMNNHSAAEEAEQREVLASLLKGPKGGRRRTDQSVRHVILYAGNEARAQWEKSTSIPNKRSADRPMYLLTVFSCWPISLPRGVATKALNCSCGIQLRKASFSPTSPRKPGAGGRAPI
jgi:hypothetical protein